MALKRSPLSIYEDSEIAEILIPASFFADNFSIDWLIQITGFKASRILGILDFAVDKGWLKKLNHGFFVFPDSKAKEKWLFQVGEQEQILLHRKIAEFLLDELPDSEDKLKTIAGHLLHVPNNDVSQCRWLIAAGDSFLKSFNVNEADRCYLKQWKT